MVNRKKILFFSSWYPIPQNPTHGIFVQRHAQAVALLNDACVLYCVGVNEKPKQKLVKKTEKNFSEYFYFYDKRNKNAWTKFKTLDKLYSEGFGLILKEFGKPDVIQINIIFPVGIFAEKIARKNKIPYVISENWTGYHPEDGSYRGVIKTRVTKKVVKNATIIVPVTQHLERSMRQHKLAGRYMYVPNVVDTDLFSLSPRENENETVFLHISSFNEEQKNPFSFIEAFEKINFEFPNTKLIMGGDGKNISALKTLAEKLNTTKEKIVFHFTPLGKELVKLYHASDVFLLNSNYENLPVVILEALCCGLPVISSDVGGTYEYVDERTGIIFKQPSAENLYKAMKEFLQKKNFWDKNKIRNYAVSEFSYAVISKKFDEVYNEALRKNV